MDTSLCGITHRAERKGKVLQLQNSSSLVSRTTLREERAWYLLLAHAPDLNSKLEEADAIPNF